MNREEKVKKMIKISEEDEKKAKELLIEILKEVENEDEEKREEEIKKIRKIIEDEKENNIEKMGEMSSYLEEQKNRLKATKGYTKHNRF